MSSQKRHRDTGAQGGPCEDGVRGWSDAAKPRSPRARIHKLWNPILNKLPGSELASAWALKNRDLRRFAERPGFVLGMQGEAAGAALSTLRLSAPCNLPTQAFLNQGAVFSTTHLIINPFSPFLLQLDLFSTCKAFWICLPVPAFVRSFCRSEFYLCHDAAPLELLLTGIIRCCKLLKRLSVVHENVWFLDETSYCILAVP